MTIDTKALPSSEPKATVALIRRYIAESYEASRTGMTCGIPKAVRVDCAMVERLCRIAEKQADRLAALEAENQRLQDSLASYVVEWIDSIKDEEGSRGAYSCDICGAENAHDPDWVDHKPTCVIKSKVAGL